MKQKILAALKTKYLNMGFGAKTFETVADFLATGATEETDIDTLVGGVENLLKAFQGDTDKRVTDAVTKAKAKSEGGEPTEPKPSENPKPDTPAGNPEIDKLMQAIHGLTQTVTGLVEKDKKTTLQARWEAQAKAKGITNPKLIEKWMPTNEEEIEANLEELEAFNAEFLKESANAESPGKPAGGSSAGSKKIAEQMLDNWARKTAPTSAAPAEQKV